MLRAWSDHLTCFAVTRMVVLGCFASQGFSALFSGRFTRSYVLLSGTPDVLYSTVFLLLLHGRVSECF